MAEMIAELKALNPRAGRPVRRRTGRRAWCPDVFVRPDPAGGWRIDLNSDTLPRILIDQKYQARVSASARSDAEKTYLHECLNQANWLIKSLDQRARTILKVSSEIVRQQDAFFVYGVEYLRPLNLKTVAEAVGMHESTISRVTSNKYIATPRGVFELKFFFTSSIASSDGTSAHSAESVRHKIKHLIDGEKMSGEVLSDDRIVELLKEAGVDIARRTVAKYREACASRPRSNASAPRAEIPGSSGAKPSPEMRQIFEFPRKFSSRQCTFTLRYQHKLVSVHKATFQNAR